MAQTTLSEEQYKLITEILKRIRDGLATGKTTPFSEPANTFEPEAFDGDKV